MKKMWKPVWIYRLQPSSTARDWEVDAATECDLELSKGDKFPRRPRFVVFLGWSGSLSSCLGIVASTQGVCLGLNIVWMRQMPQKTPVCNLRAGLVSYMPLGWQQRCD